MKITVELEKRVITLDELDEAKRMQSEMKQGIKNGENFYENELGYIASAYCDGGFKVYDLTVKVAKRHGKLAYWVECFIRGSDECANVGFYLDDFWSLTGDNKQEIRKLAFRETFRNNYRK